MGFEVFREIYKGCRLAVTGFEVFTGVSRC